MDDGKEGDRIRDLAMEPGARIRLVGHDNLTRNCCSANFRTISSRRVEGALIDIVSQ